MKKILLALLLFGSNVCRADDKALNITAAFGISAATYAISREDGASEVEATVNAFYVTMFLGVAKEIYDNTRSDDKMSFKDLGHEAIGAIAAPIFISSF